MTKAVTIKDLPSFDEAFAELGLKVGPRTGAGKRTQCDEEWYVVRRFLKLALEFKRFELPLTVRQESPPAPDFALLFGTGVALVEVTEAGSHADQRDTTLSESGHGTTSIGDHGGRFSEGIVGGHLERVWASDILRAIRRKRRKSIFVRTEPDRHLVIYPNFPALLLLDEDDALCEVRKVIARRSRALSQTTNGCAVHILRSTSVVLDTLGYNRIK